MEPKIRIKGFCGKWIKSPFSEIVNRLSSPASSLNCPGVEFEDINAGEGTLNKDVRKKKGVKFGKQFNEGDILFGKLRPYLKNILLADFKGVAIGDFWVLRPEKVTSELLYILVNSREFMRIANISSGSKMPRADWNLVSTSSFAYPTSKDEQQALGSYFIHLDSLIQSSTKKIESLKQVKAASLQAMFPQVGETTPRLRFKGFEGEWKKVIVGNVGTFYSGLSGKTKDDFGIGNVRYITFLNVLTNAKIDTTILESVKVAKGEHQNEVKKGDLLFNTSSETPEEVGMCAVMDDELEDVFLNSFCFGFRVTDKNIDSTFIAYLMRSTIGRHIMVILAQGATRYNLSKNSFSKAELLLPMSREEQTAIADYFTSLDSQIHLQTQRLEKLKQIKSACLDNMFV